MYKPTEFGVPPGTIAMRRVVHRLVVEKLTARAESSPNMRLSGRAVNKVPVVMSARDVAVPRRSQLLALDP